MDVQLEAPGGLIRQMKVRIPAERVAQALDQRLKSIAGRAKVHGFRPGKAPFSVIQKQYGEAARMEVVSDLVRGTYGEAVTQAGVTPASAPQLEVTAEKPGEALEYMARFEVYPEIKLNDLANLRIEKPQVTITDADVERLVQNLRRNRRELNVVERAAIEGDVCKADFEGKLDGEIFPGNKGENVQIEIGQGQFLPGLERALAGHVAGDSFEADVDFPVDYRNETLRGKTARFAISLKEVREPKLPEIDGEFLKAHGVAEDAGLEGMRAKVRGALEQEREKAIKNNIKNQVLDQLLAANPTEVPAAMVAQEVERMREEAAQRFGRPLKPEQKLQLFPDEVMAVGARKRTALGLLVGEVIKSMNIQLDDARVERALDQAVAEYEQPEQIKQFYRGRPDLMQGLRGLALEDQVVERLVSGAQSVDLTMPLEQLLNPRAQAAA
jgi:trigger factor